MASLETLYDLFPDQSQEAIRSLVDDPDFQKQLPGLILDKIQKSDGKILPIDLELIPLFFSRAEFAETEEAYKVARLFKNYFHNTRKFLPLLTDYLKNFEEFKERNIVGCRMQRDMGEDFASRCLFSLSLFYDALEKLHNYRSAPRPEFYREAGKRTFTSVGDKSIADNFERWEDFIREKAFA
jgi:hypothetical protein